MRLFLFVLMRLLIVCTFLSSITLAQTWYEQNISAAFTKAQKLKRPLWIMFSATWCGPCKIVEQHVLSNKAFQDTLLKDFIPLKVYAASGEKNTPQGDSLARLYQIEAFPTFLWVEPNGEVFYRHSGVPQAETTGREASLVSIFIENIEKAKIYRKELAAFRRRFQRGEHSLDFLRKYLSLLIETQLKDEGKKVLPLYLKAAGSARIAWLGEPGYILNLPIIARWDKAWQEYALNIADTLKEDLSPTLYAAIYRDILRINFSHLYGTARDWDEAFKIAESYIQKYRAKFPFVEQQVYSFLCQKGLYSSAPETKIKAASLAIKATALQWPVEIPDATERQELAETYNTLAWAFYENIEDTDKLWLGVILSKQALAYKPEAWYIWDTLGALYYKLGRKKESLEALDRAIQLARQSNIPEPEYASTLKLRKAVEGLPD